MKLGIGFPMYSMIYITAKDEIEAREIAAHLLGERLVACANIFPIKSIYRWKGEVREEGEVAMIVKTRKELVDSAIKEVRRLHSYDVPCIVCYEIVKGHEGYLNWIDEETRSR